MDVRTAIERGDAATLRRLLAKDKTLADSLICWGEGGKLRTPPIRYVCDLMVHGTLKSGQELPLIDALIEAGADLNIENGSPLNAAASLGAEDVGLRLLEAGAQPDLLGHFKESALHWAANLGLSRLVAGLIARGAPIELKDERHQATPLGWALCGWFSKSMGIVQGRHYEAIKLLVAAGAIVPSEWLNAKPILADPSMTALLQQALSASA